MFITFEGCEGSGKSTQIRAVYDALNSNGYDVLLTREPGGTDIGDQIREVVLDNMSNTDMNPLAELFLFCASRAQLVAEVIRPHMVKGGIVLCDRYTDSTLAYQGYGHGLPINNINNVFFIAGGLTPDITIYLDIDPEKGLQRSNKVDWNRLDNMTLDFHKRVYEGYEMIISKNPNRFIRANADQSPDIITKEILFSIFTRLNESS